MKTNKKTALQYFADWLAFNPTLKKEVVEVKMSKEAIVFIRPKLVKNKLK